MLTSLNRVFKFAFTDFYRNMARSVSAVFVLVMIVSLATGLFFFRGLSDYVIEEVQNKIDITAYFKTDISEEEILNAKDQIMAQNPSIKSMRYVSKADALANFTKKHQDNPVFAGALQQVGDNPFLPSLNIITSGEASQYQKIADTLGGEQFTGLIDKVDYSDKKNTIEKVFAITQNINKFGVGLAVILMLVGVLVVFNTVKLAIDNSKEVIGTQRIIGAPSWFVQAPFIIQGAIFGTASFAICFLATFALSYFLSPKLVIILSGFSLWNFFLTNLWFIIAMQLGIGVGLGAITSYLVVQKYLRV